MVRVYLDKRQTVTVFQKDSAILHFNTEWDSLLAMQSWWIVLQDYQEWLMFRKQLGGSNSVQWKITSTLKSDELNVVRGGGISDRHPYVPSRCRKLNLEKDSKRSMNSKTKQHGINKKP